MRKAKLHIIVIVLGIIFISLSAFHSNIWYDESYSIAIARHDFGEIWKIAENDVHPPLYYWFLHILYIIFGKNILCFRLFSVVRDSNIGYFGIHTY